MTLFLLILAFAYTLLRLNSALRAMDPTRYRHAAHHAHPYRRTVPDDWNPLPRWVRVRIAPTVHSRLAIGATS